jgi:hypothetical protein
VIAGKGRDMGSYVSLDIGRLQVDWGKNFGCRLSGIRALPSRATVRVGGVADGEDLAAQRHEVWEYAAVQVLRT